MPRLTNSTAQATSFGYAGVSLEKLATENTAATIIIDFSDSVSSFADQLRKALIDEIHALQKSPRRMNMVLRICGFTNNGCPGFLEELLPFTNLMAVRPDDLPPFNPDGNTPLYGATLRALKDGIEFAEELARRNFTCNIITIVITDGAQYSNEDRAKPEEIQAEAMEADDRGLVESSFLQVVGINVAACKSQLEKFCTKAGIPERWSFCDVADATPQRLAKGMGFVSKSVESQAYAAGSGGPSQTIPTAVSI
jgi:hypothetical protein